MMKTKIIPFDLEMAKKIQAGEIEGKIVRNGCEVAILDYNSKKCLGYPIRIVYLDKDEVDYVTNEGLHIEVPDNEPDNEPQRNSSYRIEQLNQLKEYTEQLMEVNQGVIDDLDSMMHELRKICNLQKN